MNPKKSEEGEPGPARNSDSLENFVSAYLSAYREYISGKDMDEIHTPQFFKAYPFTADIYALSNGTVCVLFKKGSRSKFSVVDGDFEDIITSVKNQAMDFMQLFPPFTEFTEDEAGRLARMDADRDLKSSRRLELLTAAEMHISGIQNDVQSIAELNPWLDQQAAEQKEKLDRARELIQELYSEVDISREERFSDYMHQLSEVMAFDKGEMEEVAGEMEVRLETALEDMNSRLSRLEVTVEEIGKVPESAGKAQKDISELGAKLEKLENDLSRDDSKSSMDWLRKSVKELSKNFRDMENELKTTEAEFSEVKDTAQRDGKRTFNLNERVTDLERRTTGMETNSGKDSMAAVKALEGRLNVMDKDLKKLKKKAAKYDEFMSRPVVEESPMVETVEKTPDGGRVKKTVKKTTTRKTKRSK